jgi:hypothetical protein
MRCVVCYKINRSLGKADQKDYSVIPAAICTIGGMSLCEEHMPGFKPITGKELGEIGGIPGVTEEDVKEFLKEIGK